MITVSFRRAGSFAFVDFFPVLQEMTNTVIIRIPNNKSTDLLKEIFVGVMVFFLKDYFGVIKIRELAAFFNVYKKVFSTLNFAIDELKHVQTLLKSDSVGITN